MQAAEASSPSKAQLGPWDVLDSFRLNYVHTEAAQFMNAATAEPLQFTLSFMRHGNIALKVTTKPCQPKYLCCCLAPDCYLDTQGVILGLSLSMGTVWCEALLT